jgi:phosphopantothenoylcysteine decarboxylase/phosphopantothenate--cysteine ligase
VHCVVTAGPTYEPLDEVRRLTNFSTGRLGTELANYLTASGHKVTLLLGEHATFRGPCSAERIQGFTTTSDLAQRLQASEGVDAIFHAAAVSDFKFGKVWLRSEGDTLTEIKSGKLSTRRGTLLAELVPTGKIISQLRTWFPSARLVGWKFEVEGDQDRVLQLAKDQIAECRTDGCVANGPGYGPGFAMVTRSGKPRHFATRQELFGALQLLLEGAVVGD